MYTEMLLPKRRTPVAPGFEPGNLGGASLHPIKTKHNVTQTVLVQDPSDSHLTVSLSPLTLQITSPSPESPPIPGFACEESTYESRWLPRSKSECAGMGP